MGDAKNSVNKVRITILGSKYSISSSEPPEYVESLAKEINRTVSSFLSDSGAVSSTDALVLTCLQFLDERKKSELDADRLRLQVSEYLDEAAAARLEALAYRTQLEDAKHELDVLRKQRATRR